ncbi:MAG: hypothetical protein ACLQSR_18360, partial [Limisphaerales bacterium]
MAGPIRESENNIGLEGLPIGKPAPARIFHIALETTTDRSADRLSAWDFRMPKAGCKPALRPYLERVVDGLGPYAYSITVENDWRDAWFCERLICCFCTGVVPIYWGSREIYQL